MNTNTLRHSAASRIHPTMPAFRSVVVASVLASSVAIGAVVDGPAHAVPANQIEVVNRADDGSPTSLRSAVTAANADGGNWTIVLQPGQPYVIDRLCRNGNLDDNHGGDLDLVTEGSVTFATPPGVTDRATIMVACVGERILDHHGEGSVVLRNIRLTGGNTAKGANGIQNGNRDGQRSADGGAVRSTGTVGLLNAQIDGNSTGAGGAGAPPLFSGVGGKGGNAGLGSAVSADSFWSLGSTVINNVTGDGGPGGNGVGAGNAGGMGGSGGNGTIAAFVVHLTRSQVEGNALGDGGTGGTGIGAGAPGGDGGRGGSGAGVISTDFSLDASTIANNVAGSGGKGGDGKNASGGDGGTGGDGGGVWAASATIRRSTIHANEAGGALRGGSGTPSGVDGYRGVGGGLHVSVGPVDINFATITANAARSGANLNVPAVTTLTASVVGESVGSASCSGPVVNLDYTVHNDNSCGPANFVFASLGLGVLQDNGGPTTTRLPDLDGPISGFIPEGSCADLTSIAYDQRDEIRPLGNCSPGAVELPPFHASAYTALSPTRVFDTRESGQYGGFISGGATRTVQFTGVAGIPTEGVTAVAFNLTIDASTGPGYVTAYSADGVKPLASSLNTVRAGQTVPNFVVVPVGPTGAVTFFSQTGGHLIADAVGYFTESARASAGRTIPLTPARLFDTREPGPVNGKVPAGGQITVDVTGIGGVPDSGVAAVVINVTATEASGAGYVTVAPGGQPLPLASTLNLDGPGHTAANVTIVPVGADGTITLYSQSGTHLLADVTAYITDSSAPLATRGLFVPSGPFRLFDTRTSGSPIAGGFTLDVVTIGAAWIPPYAEAVLLNVTATEAVAAGFVTGFPTGAERPLASTLNLTASGETRANAALLPVGDNGSISYFSQSGTHLLAEWFGYFLPAPEPLNYVIAI